MDDDLLSEMIESHKRAKESNNKSDKSAGNKSESQPPKRDRIVKRSEPKTADDTPPTKSPTAHSTKPANNAQPSAPKQPATSLPNARPSVEESDNAFVYFIVKKNAKGGVDGQMHFKIGTSDNVGDTRKQLEEGAIGMELKTFKVIKCHKMDGARLADKIQADFQAKHIHRGWYDISKDVVDKKIADITKNSDYECITESRAKTKARK